MPSGDPAARNRRSYSAARKRALLRRYAASGLSVTKFCQECGINVATFCNWRRPERAEGQRAPERLGFARVRVTTPIALTSGPVVIELPNALRLAVPLGTDPEWVSKLVGTLTGS